MASRPIVDNNATPPAADRMMLAEELLDLAERAQSHAHAAGSAIALKLGEKLFVRTSTGLAPEVGACLPMGVGTIGECARLGKPLTASEDKVDAPLRLLGVRSLIAVPIHHAGIFYGVLVVLGQTPETFTRMHVAIMMTMGNEVARVLKRMEPVAVEIAPGAPLRPAAATPPPAPAVDDNVVEIALSSSARQNIAETLKTIEQKPEPVATPAPPAPMKLIIDPPAPKRVAATESKPPAITPQPVKPAEAPLAKLEEASVAPQPLPDLLVPGDDPRRYGTLKTAKSLEPKPTFTSANAYVVPTSPSRLKVPAMAAAAVLLAIIGYGVLHYGKSTAAAATHEPAAIAQPAATPTPVSAPVSTPVVETVKVVPVTAVAVPGAKEAARPVVESKTIEVKASEPRAEEPKAAPAALRIATVDKHDEAASAEAPNLTLVASPGMPDLLAPKAASAKLAVKKTTATPPTLLHSVAPVFPDIARRAGTYGDVHMQLTISPEGKVSNVKVLDGAPILRQAATSAVSQWTYRAATLDGRPIDSTVDVVVKFAQR